MQAYNYLLEVNNLSHKFDTLLYSEVHFQLYPQESLAILGTSGSGKSTILNHLSTLLPPQHGSISLAQYHDIYQLKEKDLLFLRQKILGIIFQSHYLFRGFNVLENLRIAELISNLQYNEKLLEHFGIANTLKQQIGQLSGGQQQRLSIARILTKQPRIVLADEPTGNLDKDTAMNIMKYLFEYIQTQNATLVLATHDNSLAENCTKIMLLENKKLRILK
ncbi:ABC transporter ATP-binding protein [Helicobacter aurati]|uniref:ABC transporter ATP-binding protein n=1 Tax=Helicobacter aurati TaxID=137778 RepID=A0A3D8J8A0_9HELI|nr:ATP-binding cassette domain-containing protein [Helicobacter aurati]RDU73733.1 ABC transporter ATP-binding protein [Helicobacter aurati]